jgi:hypothetical protein
VLAAAAALLADIPREPRSLWYNAVPYRYAVLHAARDAPVTAR